MTKNHSWTVREENYLREKYPDTHTKLIAKALHISYNAVKARAYGLGLIKQNRKQRAQREPKISHAVELARQGIYTMRYFDQIPNYHERPLRKQAFSGVKSSANWEGEA